VQERGADSYHHYAGVSVRKIVGRGVEIGIEEVRNEYIIHICEDNEFLHNYRFCYNILEHICYCVSELIIKNVKDLWGIRYKLN